MGRPRHWTDAARLGARALAAGATVPAVNNIHWDVSKGCVQPFMATIEGRSALLAGRDEWGDVRKVSPFNENLQPLRRSAEYGYQKTLWVDVLAPCRKCAVCARNRARLWAGRARAEISIAPRTWFATFTKEPEQQYLLSLRAEASDPQKWHESEDKFPMLAAEFGKDLTKYFKRLRKNTGRQFRYLLVAEAHKSGLPHMHALIHERAMSQPILKRELQREWKDGFTTFKLTDREPKVAWYVCKYISKSSLARVRASVNYGDITKIVTNVA